MTKSFPAARALGGTASPANPASVRATSVRIASRLIMRFSSLARARSERRVEHVAQPVAEEIEAEHGGEDGHAWEGRAPPGRGEELPALHDHVAPARGRRL